MAQNRGRRRGSPCACWPMVVFGIAVSIFNSFFWKDEREKFWPADNTTVLSVSRVGANDTEMEGIIFMDGELLSLVKLGARRDGEFKGQSIAAIVLGALTIFFCLLIWESYGDYDMVRNFKFYLDLKLIFRNIQTMQTT